MRGLTWDKGTMNPLGIRKAQSVGNLEEVIKTNLHIWKGYQLTDFVT
jgi:hypothetical protein